MEAALAALDERRQEINDLNVFPVADGDTGDNMVLTVRAVTEELARLEGESSGDELDDISRTQIVEAVARAALLGARGNSGVILSQLIRGAAEELISTRGRPVDPLLLASAMSKAAGQARESVREPQEGTILTVIDDMAGRVAEVVGSEDLGELPDDVDAETQNKALAAALAQAVEAGEQSVARGPQLLDVLRESGVVDAGGYGLVVLFAAVLASLLGEDGPKLAHQQAPTTVVDASDHSSETFRYCVNFAVSGEGLGREAFLAGLEEIGDSVLVVGDQSTIRVHVHVDDPNAAAALFDSAGTVSRLEVADMHDQVLERAQRLSGGAKTKSVALAVVVGEQIKALFEAEGARVLECPKTLNPSTRELADAIEQLAAEEVVLLTGSGNVVMAAQEAARLAEKPVEVVATRTLQEGLLVLAAQEDDRSAADNAAAIRESLAEIKTAAIAQASVDDGEGRFKVGEAVGFAGGEIIAWGDPEQVLEAVVGSLEGAELMIGIHDESSPFDHSAIEAAASSFDHVELHVGRQPGWWLLLAAE